MISLTHCKVSIMVNILHGYFAYRIHVLLNEYKLEVHTLHKIKYCIQVLRVTITVNVDRGIFSPKKTFPIEIYILANFIRFYV